MFWREFVAPAQVHAKSCSRRLRFRRRLGSLSRTCAAGAAAVLPLAAFGFSAETSTWGCDQWAHGLGSPEHFVFSHVYAHMPERAAGRQRLFVAVHEGRDVGARASFPSSSRVAAAALEGCFGWEARAASCETLGERIAGEAVVDLLTLDACPLEALQSVDWQHSPSVQFVAVADFDDGDRGTTDIREVHAKLRAQGFELLARVGGSRLFRRRGAAGADANCQAVAWKFETADGDIWIPWQSFQGVATKVSTLIEPGSGPVASNDKGGLEMLMALSESEDHEATCPLGVFVARLSLAIAINTIDRRSIIGEIRSHRLLLSEAQKDLLRRRAGSSVAKEDLSWQVPLPALFLSGLDFDGALRAQWPIFELLDAISRYLWAQRSDPSDVSFDDGLTPDHLVRKFTASGLFSEVRTRLDQGFVAAADRDAPRVRRLLSAVDLMLKQAALAFGLLWLLEHSGEESPTLWRRLADLRLVVLKPPAPVGPAPSPVGSVAHDWKAWYERRDHSPRPTFQDMQSTLHNGSERPFVMCVPPKNGSSRWFRLLRRVDGNQDYLKNPHFTGRKDSGLQYLGEHPVAFQREVWTSSHNFKVFLARNPLIRALSAYSEKREELSLPSTFEGFVEARLNNMERKFGDVHWWPQTQICESPASVHYDFIAHVENRTDWMPMLFDVVGIQDAASSGWGESGKEDFTAAFGDSKSTGSDRLDKLRTHYTKKTFNIAACFYWSDIELLGYVSEVFDLWVQLWNVAPPPLPAICDGKSPPAAHL